MTSFHCQSAEMRKTGKGGEKTGSKKKVIKGAAKSNVCDRKRFCCDMTHTHAKVGCCHIRSLLCRTNQTSIQHVFISTLNLTAKGKHTRETIHTKEQNKSLKRINYVRKKRFNREKISACMAGFVLLRIFHKSHSDYDSTCSLFWPLIYTKDH